MMVNGASGLRGANLWRAGVAVLALVALALGLAPAVALAQETPPAQRGAVRIQDPDTDPRVRAIARDLQCPVCENLSVADSPSDLARDMRALIARQLEQGRSREEIERYFVERYGEGILLRPSSSGFSGLVWLGPWIALALGLLLVLGTLRRARRGSGLRVPSPESRAGGRAPDAERGTRNAELARYEELLERELERYREQVG